MLRRSLRSNDVNWSVILDLVQLLVLTRHWNQVARPIYRHCLGSMHLAHVD